MSKHTPGPWVFEVRDSGTFRIRMGTALESPDCLRALGTGRQQMGGGQR